MIPQSYSSEYFILIHSIVKASSLSDTEGEYKIFSRSSDFWKEGRKKEND